MNSTDNIELRDENIYPDEERLSSVLGQSYDSYIKLLEIFQKHKLNYEWRYYKDARCWLCKVQKNQITIVWMAAHKDNLLATIYVPLKLLDNVLSLDLSECTKNEIINTKNIGKSKPCIFIIKSNGILIDLEKVIEFKIINK